MRDPSYHGPGKYDAACSLARWFAEAHTTILIVINGNQGSGFSVQTVDVEIMDELPAMLRMLADNIEAGQAGGEGERQPTV